MPSPQAIDGAGCYNSAEGVLAYFMVNDQDVLPYNIALCAHACFLGGTVVTIATALEEVEVFIFDKIEKINLFGTDNDTYFKSACDKVCPDLKPDGNFLLRLISRINLDRLGHFHG